MTKAGLSPAFLLEAQHLHPSIKILSLLFLTMAVYLASMQELLSLIAVLFILLVYFKAGDFLNLLRRMRWLLLFLLLVYAFNTPGEYVAQWPFDFAPTYEGIAEGFMQMTRIGIMLAGVALLLATTTRDKLIAGFFLVLYPMKWIGLDPERLAVRLWLTLHYVDHAPAIRSIAAFLDSLDKANQSADMQQGQPQSVRLEIPPFSWGDLAAVFLMLIVGFYLS